MLGCNESILGLSSGARGDCREQEVEGGAQEQGTPPWCRALHSRTFRGNDVIVSLLTPGWGPPTGGVIVSLLTPGWVVLYSIKSPNKIHDTHHVSDDIQSCRL